MQMKIWMYENLEEPSMSPTLILDWDVKENPPEFLTEWLPGFWKKKTRNSVKLYIKKCVPKSSILKAMLCGYHHYRFFEWHTRSNFTLFPKKCFMMQSLFIVQTRTLKHKKSPFFCMYAEGNLRKLSQLHIKTSLHYQAGSYHWVEMWSQILALQISITIQSLLHQPQVRFLY